MTIHFKKTIPLIGALLALLTSAAHSSTQDAQIPLPDVRIVDPLGVNLQTQQATVSQDTVSIGGERGLSHSISMQTSHFSTTGGWYGYVDKYAGVAKYVKFAEYPHAAGFSGTHCETIQGSEIWVMRLSGPEGSEEFKVRINGVVDCHIDGAVTSGYSFEALGDPRNSLDVVSSTNELKWTRPDGTALYYARSAGVNPVTATTQGRLQKIVYPSGYTIAIDTGNVTSNTGFHLKYEIDTANTQPLSSAKQSLFNALSSALSNYAPGQVLQIQDEAPGQFAALNPKHVRAVNRAVDYCSPSVQTCGSQWPAATFTWPGGMPRAIYLGESVFTVEDAAGRTADYHYQAQDVMLRENGEYAGNVDNVNYPYEQGPFTPYYPGQMWSPRLTGIKSPGSSVIDRTFEYRNPFVLKVMGAGAVYLPTDPANPVGELKQARGPVEDDADGVGYYHTPLPSGAQASQAGWHQGEHRVEPADGHPGRIGVLTAANQGQFTYQNTYQNRITDFIPIDSAAPDKHYQYDSRGNLTTVTLRQGQTDQTQIRAGYPAACTTANRKTCNKPDWIIDARGHQTDYTYHAPSGQVATVTGPADANGIRPVTRYTYAQQYAYYKKTGNTVEAADSPIWLLTREASCRTTATSGTSCAGGPLDEVVTEYDYGPQDGRPNNLWRIGVSVTAEVDGALQTRTTCYEYDIYGHRIGETAPKGVSGACPAFDPQSIQQPAPYKSAKRYSPAGQLLGEIRPDPDGDNLDVPAVRYTYNNRGLLIETEHGVLSTWQDPTVNPANWSGFTVSHREQFGYDEVGRKISESRAAAAGNRETLSQKSYDAYSRTDCATVRLNPAQAPNDACTLGPESAHGPDRLTRYYYDDNDNLLEEHRAVGTDLEQVHVKYAYTPENQIDTVTDANGNVAQFQYDNYGRKTVWCFPSKIRDSGQVNCGDYERYQYDNNGNRTQLRKRDGKLINYVYDNLNRLTKKDLPNTTSGDVYYGYELTGAQLHARFGSHTGAGIQTNYTGFGEPEQDTTTVGGVTRTITRTFDANGNRTRITHPDNQFFTYNFDGLNRLDTIEDTSGNLLIADSYDPFARPESRVTAGNAITALTYDSISRLNTIGFQFSGTADDLTLGFGYNPAGQLAHQTVSNSEYHHAGGIGKTGDYAVNGLNQYDSVGGTTFTYDDNGNLTDDGPNIYTYDVENRLISVTGSNTASLSYDPMGRLYRYTVNGTTTDFLYDGDSLIAEYQGGVLTKRYVHGLSTDTPLVQYIGSAVGTTNRQFLHRNHQGSVIAITDNTSAVVNINTYDAYGVPGSGNQGRFGYTGQMYLPELGLYHYRARVYNPYLGRMQQTDPVGYKDQINLYAYVGNDPLNNVDPTGMSKTGWLLKETASALRKAEKRLKKNASARGRRAALKNERQALIETGESKSRLSPERKNELIETGKLKNMDGHHDPSISSGSTLEEKVKIAENPDNITFMEKPDHQALHNDLGGTQVPIAAKILGGAAAALEFVEQNFPDTLQTLDALDPVGTMGMEYLEQANDPCKNGSMSCI